MKRELTGAALFGLCLSLPLSAAAQEGEAPAAPPGGDPGGAVPPTTTTTYSVPYLPPTTSTTTAPFDFDVDRHLPSSSQSTVDTSRSADGFDIPSANRGGDVVRGGADSAYVVSGQHVPDTHTAKRGDTLWDISAKYYGNPYIWPRVWSYNRQIQNPHWIYPGDHIRLQGGHGVTQVGAGVGFARQKPLVTPNTYFARHLGWVSDDRAPVWGEVLGSPDDQMLLSENDQIYIQLSEDQSTEVGALLTIFEKQDVDSLTDKPLVYVRGIVKVNRYNPQTRAVRARIVESLDVIERGQLVGPADRQVDVVQPKRNQKTVQARIVASLYPHAFYAKHQTVFIDKGSEDGLEVGNRFFAVARGDEWRLNLKNAGNLASARAITDDDRYARVEDTPDTDKPELYPSETYAELLVVRTRRHTSTCVVTASVREVSRGAVVIAREGY